MNKHILEAKELTQIITLEESKNYLKCISILQAALTRPCQEDTPDIRYENAAYHLRLSVYQMICGMSAYEENLNKAKLVLPSIDILALSASWLDRTGEHADLVEKYCKDYFELIGEDYDPPDVGAMVFFEKMLEIKSRSNI